MIGALQATDGVASTALIPEYTGKCSKSGNLAMSMGGMPL